MNRHLAHSEADFNPYFYWFSHNPSPFITLYTTPTSERIKSKTALVGERQRSTYRWKGDIALEVTVLAGSPVDQNGASQPGNTDFKPSSAQLFHVLVT